MDLGARIKQLRLAESLTQPELAARLNVATSTLCQYETGQRTPSDGVKSRIATLFGVSVDYLIGHTGSDSANVGIKIPVLGSIPAGIPLEAIEEVVDWEELSPDRFAGGREYFALQVSGDSMYPEYLDGDIVIVQAENCCESGDVCVVYINGYDATLKQVKLGTDGSIAIIPRNPEYPPRTYSAEEVATLPITIAGVVVELRRRTKK